MSSDVFDVRSRRAAGFGLAEVLITIVCISSLLAVGVPNLHRLSQEWNLRAGAAVLETSLHWGRMHAVSTNSSLMLIVSADGRQFFWADAACGDRYETAARQLHSGVRITSAPGRPLRFFQRGNAAPAGTYVVQGSTGAYRIVVSPGGRIRIQRI